MRPRRGFRRGFGQDVTYDTVPTPAGDYQVFSNGTIWDPNGNIVSSIPFPVTMPSTFPDIGTPPIFDPGAMTPGAPFNWNNFFGNLFSAGTKAFQASQIPSGYFVDPSTGRLVNQQAGQYVGGPYNPLLGTSGFSLAGIMPWLLLVGGVVLVGSVLGGKR